MSLRLILSMVLCLPVFLASGQMSDAADRGVAGFIVENAEQVLGRGYGGICSLMNEPVLKGGYFPCLDFGPYRYVSGYNKVTVFVVGKQGALYPVLGGSRHQPGFLVDGPWETHMGLAIAGFMSEVVEGGQARTERSRERDRQRQAAVDRIESVMDAGQSPVGQVSVEDSTHSPLGDPIGQPIDMQKPSLQELLSTER